MKPARINSLGSRFSTVTDDTEGSRDRGASPSRSSSVGFRRESRPNPLDGGRKGGKEGGADGRAEEREEEEERGGDKRESEKREKREREAEEVGGGGGRSK